MKGSGTLQDIEALFKYLSNQPSGSNIHMNGNMLEMRPAAPSGTRCLPSSRPNVVPVARAVTKENIDTGLFKLKQAPQETLISGVSISGLTLSNVTFKLRSDQCLILELCSRLRLQDVVIRGGTVVATGTACLLQLKNVAFEKCSLVILNGANVQMEKSTFSSDSVVEDSNGVCIYAQGAGTIATVNDCHLTGGLHCIVACDGAVLKATRMHCASAGLCGVSGSGVNSKIKLQKCEVSSMAEEFANVDRKPNEEGKTDFFCTGVLVNNACMAELDELTVTKVEIGISIDRKGVAHATNCSITECIACGVNVSKSSTASFRKCVMQGAQCFHGLHVDGEGSCVEAYNCKFESNKQSGAGAYGGSKLTLSRCHTSDNGASGYWAQGGGHVVLTDCTSYEDTVGCGGIEKGSSVSAARLQVSNSYQSGVVVDQEARAIVTESVVIDCVQACAMVSAGAECVIQESRLERAKSGHGMEVKGGNSVGRARKCVFRDNSEAGAAVFCRGLMELHSCESERNEVAGFWSQDGGMLLTHDCISKHDDVGCGTRGAGSTVNSQNITVQGNSLGVLVIAGGTMEAYNSTIQGSTSSGVSCGDAGSRLDMHGGHVSGCAESGLCAQDGCRVRVKNVTTTRNRLCSFLCSGPDTRMELTGTLSSDERVYMVYDSAKLVCRGCYPKDTTDAASVFRKFKDLDVL